MKTQCPNCQATYHIIPEFIGRKTVCQICGHTFAIAEVREEDLVPVEAVQTEELPAVPPRESQTEGSQGEQTLADEPQAEAEAAPRPAEPVAACFPAALLARTIRPANLTGQSAEAAPMTAADEPPEPNGDPDMPVALPEAADEPPEPNDDLDMPVDLPEAADEPPEPNDDPDMPVALPEAGRELPEAADEFEAYLEPQEALYETIEPDDFSDAETAPLTAAELAASFHPEPEAPPEDPLDKPDFQAEALPFSPVAGPRPPHGGSWLVQAGFGLLGVILGAGLMWLLNPGGTPVWRSADPDAASAVAAKTAAINEERGRLQRDMAQAEAYIKAYPEGSVPQALAVAAREEYGIADALLLQQAVALETGAKVKTVPPQSRPDPELAGRLEKEIADLTAEIVRRQREAESLADVPRTVAATGIETLNINLGLLKRNYLTAKYGLRSPLPPPESPPKKDSGPEAELERLKAANAELQAENEKLRHSAAALYAQALAEVEAGNPAVAVDILRRLAETFPDSPLNGPAAETLARIEIQAAAAATAQKPPVVISSASLKHDGGYFENETQVRIAFQNVSPLVIKQLEFKVLTFDENGLPVASRKLGSSPDNDLNAVLTENIPPNKADYGLWELSDQVRQVKIKLKQVDFYDAEPWVDESIDEWLEKESGRFAAAD